MVEIDPYDPASTPVKRTALGRMAHEGSTVVVNKDGKVVVYMGDDDYFEYVYRFVSDAAYDAANPASCKDILDAGTLSVAQFAADGTLTWLPLVHGQGPLTAGNGFADQAEVLLKTRLAADTVGATPMDRPEGVETNPVTGRVYANMTKNKKMTAEKLNAVNTRPENHYGHIVAMIPEVVWASMRTIRRRPMAGICSFCAAIRRMRRMGQNSTPKPWTAAGSFARTI